MLGSLVYEIDCIGEERIVDCKNFMEDAVERKVDMVMQNFKDCCTCEECRRDIVSIALNNLKPKYVATDRGEMYARIDDMSVQSEVEVIQALTAAIEIVRKNPHHTK